MPPTEPVAQRGMLFALLALLLASVVLGSVLAAHMASQAVAHRLEAAGRG